MPAGGSSPAILFAVCTQCGGESPVSSGQRFVRCSFCDATLHVDRSGTVALYALPWRLDHEEAEASLRRWMAGNDTVKDLDRKSTLDSVSALSFPMWLFRAQVKGREEVFVEPAAATPVPQLADLRVPAGELVPGEADTEGAEAVPVGVDLEVARGWIAERGVAAIQETALVQVPLWNVTYTFGDRSYRALVEASTGSVLAAVFPEKSESPFVAVAVLGVILFGLEGLLISNLLLKALAYLVTALPLGLLAWWVARKV